MYRKHVVDGSAFITGPQPKASCELSSQNSLRKYMVSNLSKVQPEGVISPSFQKTGRAYYFFFFCIILRVQFLAVFTTEKELAASGDKGARTRLL